VEGIVTIDTALTHELPIPVVAVAGHRKIPASPTLSSTTGGRPSSPCVICTSWVIVTSLSCAVSRSARTPTIAGGVWCGSQGTWDRNSAGADDQVGAGSDFTELGYPVVQELLKHRRAFTAIVSFNDIAAIGAIRALRDANLRVPEDVSVIGFDDIQVAAYHNPRLTTIRQPLHDMGETAARILLQRMQGFKELSDGTCRASRTDHSGNHGRAKCKSTPATRST